MQHCNFSEAQADKIRSLSCLPLYVAGLKTLPYHDTGSSITLHSHCFITNLPEKCKSTYSMTRKRLLKFKGITGRRMMCFNDECFSKYHVQMLISSNQLGGLFARRVDQAPICVAYPGMVLDPMPHNDMRDSPSRTKF